jgi:hypothetical protein
MKEPFQGMIWEPACGAGWISKVLIDYGYYVVSSDIQTGRRIYGSRGIDFLNTNFKASNIITNPPYSCLGPFLEQGLKLARRKLCILVRLAALEGSKRWRDIYSRSPPTRVLVFSNRVTMYKYGIKTAGSGTTAYTWLVWDKQDPNYGRPGSTQLLWIEPGHKQK